MKRGKRYTQAAAKIDHKAVYDLDAAVKLVKEAATAKFDGKVIRSTHATIKVGATCRGELERERGSPSAKVKVSCDTPAPVDVYAGTGGFTLDVKDTTRRDDDHSEYDDSKTTDADGTPGCRVSGSGASGTLTIWDTSPAFELVVEL